MKRLVYFLTALPCQLFCLFVVPSCLLSYLTGWLGLFGRRGLTRDEANCDISKTDGPGLFYWARRDRAVSASSGFLLSDEITRCARA